MHGKQLALTASSGMGKQTDMYEKETYKKGSWTTWTDLVYHQVHTVCAHANWHANTQPLHTTLSGLSEQTEVHY